MIHICIISTKLKKHPRNDGLWLIAPHNDVLSYSQMEIPASSLINRYIACQGPLPNTCPDFWQMAWEQGSSLVVMLTTQVERGRVCISLWNCNRYGFILTKELLLIYIFFFYFLSLRHVIPFYHRWSAISIGRTPQVAPHTAGFKFPARLRKETLLSWLGIWLLLTSRWVVLQICMWTVWVYS